MEACFAQTYNTCSSQRKKSLFGVQTHQNLHEFLLQVRERQAYLFGFNEFELHAAAGPCDEVGVARVIQQGHQELPELQGASALVRCALTENSYTFLLHLTWIEKDTVFVFFTYFAFTT